MPELGKLVAFFDFKDGRDGLLHFSGMTACSETLSVITRRRFCVQATDNTGKPASTTPARDKNKPTLDRYYKSVYFILHDKFWIGHGLVNSDWAKLEEEFNHIGKPSPKPKGIIDSVPFISSGTKLAQLAVLFGLGEPSLGYYNNCEENYDAIKQCRDAMPILDMEKEKDMGSNIYPMISHLRKFQQPPEKATTKSARGSEPRKSQKLEGKENPPRKSLAESPSSLEERLLVAMKMLEREDRVTFFDFKKGSNGLLHFGGMEVTSKTLEFITETRFCVQATQINGRPARNTPAWLKNEPTLSESYNRVYYMLHNKTWIGHDLRKSDFPMLEKECKHIGKSPPRPKEIIDTVPFISSGSKLGKLAVLLGLGKPAARLDCRNCQVNYNAIKKCRDAMPILDVEIEQDKESNMHPMISLIKKYQQPPEEETSILFGHEEETTKRKSPQGKVKDGGVRKSLRLKEASQRLKKKSM
ncbi:protein NEN1 isoform X1 [Arabidopsis lyrata subsp. lyrata]|uniref:protein NEN1 isoform X1 n=1 Tax=Arabidopsis lyrata subsp. lyrata TaxID=81972 RepID=UPI000A29AA66|nr:protein NEN1 isoform X1 [Arabidopsis lyrata subsp. lyrata]XP_020881282.1 protein NEN1 isoform X1 [Arabidopsis lyrata subsp. lyrata]|eukprot:XP_020881281.1 protein NEN1 isoform X1 [Arabidopsis lyrata subsp. lyrata]